MIGSKEGQGEGGNVNDEQREGFVSGYDESGDEIDTPIEDKSRPGHRIKTDILVVNELTDFKKLKWSVGMRFPSREVFRDYVTRYSVAIGRDVVCEVSNDSRGKRLGVKCSKDGLLGCMDAWTRKVLLF